MKLRYTMPESSSALVEIIDGAGATVYEAIMTDFLQDLGRRDFSFNMLPGIGGFEYNTGAGAQPLLTLRDVKGNLFPFPRSGNWPDGDAILKRTPALTAQAKARAIVATNQQRQLVADWQESLARSAILLAAPAVVDPGTAPGGAAIKPAQV